MRRKQKGIKCCRIYPVILMMMMMIITTVTVIIKTFWSVLHLPF